jgi:hypothetical protein
MSESHEEKKVENKRAQKARTKLDEENSPQSLLKLPKESDPIQKAC